MTITSRPTSRAGKPTRFLVVGRSGRLECDKVLAVGRENIVWDIDLPLEGTATVLGDVHILYRDNVSVCSDKLRGELDLPIKR